MKDVLINILQNNDPISLDELAVCRLLNRIDTKYICHVNNLPPILEKSQKDFRVQEIGNERIFKYESLYFDTPDMRTYFDHHQGKRNRYKIRLRTYMDTGDTFLEVKKKKNYRRTDKRRTQIDFTDSLTNLHYDFIGNHIPVKKDGLSSTIWTIFDRITLVGKNHIERITIDTNIRFRKGAKEIVLPDLSIIEVKREKTGGISPFSQILHDSMLRPYGISKYILGNMLLTPELKHNRFTKKLLTINKICYGSRFHN